MIKGEKALGAYGSRARKGVIEISTKPTNPDAARQATVVHITDKRDAKN